jgi:hypothetical protein
MLGFVSLLFLLIGLTTIYFKNAEAFGKVGALGFILSFLGIGGLSWINGFAAMAEPALVLNAPSLLDPSGPIFGGLAGIFFRRYSDHVNHWFYPLRYCCLENKGKI